MNKMFLVIEAMIVMSVLIHIWTVYQLNHFNIF